MIKILFICHGNICRSPMAEFVMKKLVSDAGLQAQIETASAATSSEEIGNPVYPPVRKLLSEHGIDCTGKAARRMTKEDYDEYDLLICMDSANMRNMQRICGGDSENKMYMLMEFAESSRTAGVKDNAEPSGIRADTTKMHTGAVNQLREVADPWYTRDFEATWRDINEGCTGLLKKIKENF